MIEITDKTVGLWSAGWLGCDYLASLREIKVNEEYELIYRFRYHTDDKVFDSDDVKSWYKGKLHGTKDRTMASVRNTIDILRKLNGPKFEEFELLMENGNVEDFMKQIEQCPMFHCKTEMRQ